MGRPALTDAEKKAKGTFDPRYSADARAERATEKVVTLPVLDHIPKCRLPLAPGGIGQETYDSLIRTLHEQKRLTVMSHLEVEALAAGYEVLHRKMSAGGNVPASAIQGILSRIDKLQRMDVDRPFAGSSTDRPNKFSRNGFAQRKR
ncbi:hypothetical protein [uncultured Alsobacter sp.]|uniref:hypothetical protein n=1 Tax=uncultured Alsobacter sp. TaxID=1748258 RepID=UPI0025F2C5A3|nr:hypothetical protein [uncultured Alsobacter sp.]